MKFMDPIAPTDADKPLATLCACIEELNSIGATGKLVWSDGFRIPLGTIVRLEILTGDDPRFFFLIHAVMGFEHGGGHDGGVHVHKIVNWYAEDPPLEFAVIDTEGRTLEFSLIEPSCEVEIAREYQSWREELNQQPELRERAYAGVHGALASMARSWPEDY